ncbi:hypothetical protein ACIBF5_12575 [Micromonospora sp. NPDC050417]|uniref:hypothetical protein n=1 Tax=Micromonospora sp. NPDC050417 TaxID=3364280 RepID=UPI0037B52660
MLPPPGEEAAAAHPYTVEGRRTVERIRQTYALGSPETVRAQLTEVVRRTDADELMLETMVYDPKDRVRSHELIAR